MAISRAYSVIFAHEAVIIVLAALEKPRRRWETMAYTPGHSPAILRRNVCIHWPNAEHDEP